MILFEKYIYSPFFNESEEQQLLFKELKKHYQQPVEARTALKKQEVWTKIYKNRKYVDVIMRRLTSGMTRLAEDFLVHKSLKEGVIYRDILLLEAVKKNTRKQFFIQNYDKISIKQQEKRRNVDFYYEKFSIEILRHELEDLLAPMDNQLFNLEEANKNLDNYFILNKLKFYCVFLNYKAAHPVEGKIELPAFFLKDVQKSQAFEEPLIKLYFYTVLLFLKEEPDKQYNQIERLLIEYEDILTTKDIKNIYFCLQNYCALQLNSGNTSYFEKLFNVYKTMIERGVLPGEEPLKPEVYKNILTLGLMVKEFIWVENFIQEYTQKLPLEYQENALNYNLANLYFHQKKYQEVIEQLREVQYKNLSYAISSKLMLLRTYYELEETRSLDSLIDSFRVYLRRNQLISKEVKQQCMNALRFTKKIIVTPKYEKAKLAKVKSQIESCTALAIKKWLLEKIGEKEGRRSR